jgi:sec-independent protein translocase protein TatA
MFGIGGGELVFILFIALMLFGADKIPEIARTVGKAMAQLKNATNEIQHEIQKSATENGFDSKSLNSFTDNITKEINTVAEDTFSETKAFAETKNELEESIGAIKRTN